jgi:hypothetical protein
MKNTFEEVAWNRLGVPTIPFPTDDLLHVRVSINIAEILEYLEDADFEDWLTAALIENASRIPLRHLCVHGACGSEICSLDVWMVEITQRTGKIWNGKFQVEFDEVQRGFSQAELSSEHRSGEIFFTLDTASAEIVFVTNVDGA